VLGQPGLRGYVLRTAWLYGAHGGSFVRAMIGKARSPEPVQVVDDQRGQPTWTMDVAGRIAALIGAAAPPGIYHATSSGETTWFGLAQEVFRLVGADPDRISPVSSAALARPAPRPGYSVLGHDAWARAGPRSATDRWRCARPRLGCSRRGQQLTQPGAQAGRAGRRRARASGAGPCTRGSCRSRARFPRPGPAPATGPPCPAPTAPAPGRPARRCPGPGRADARRAHGPERTSTRGGLPQERSRSRSCTPPGVARGALSTLARRMTTGAGGAQGRGAAAAAAGRRGLGRRLRPAAVRPRGRPGQEAHHGVGNRGWNPDCSPQKSRSTYATGGLGVAA